MNEPSLNPLKRGDSKPVRLFHPMCGILTEGSSERKRTTSVPKIPSPAASPSSLWRHITCIPTQIPSTGHFKDGITESSPRDLRLARTTEASPTPVKRTLSAATSLPGAEVSSHSVAPIRLSSQKLSRLPSDRWIPMYHQTKLCQRWSLLSRLREQSRPIP